VWAAVGYALVVGVGETLPQSLMRPQDSRPRTFLFGLLATGPIVDFDAARVDSTMYLVVAAAAAAASAEALTVTVGETRHCYRQ
jgi:hypothetical protein